ncbi:EVE domain-containing protein [Actinoplanes sp. DH11]|uniref:EVE domain-containing protein n=1 Tax=Actinoplanes sp. DH11 TaxID=2857011 RepID=UPI001E2C1381|nr:EVE domain-containing protein [Actinoplanes sp. DH11]
MTSDKRRVTPDDLGAWLLKGNADHGGLRERFAEQPGVEQWCVQRSYRLELMAAGQPVLFWGSGSRSRDIAYGIWGLGRLRGPARQQADGGGWEVPLDLTIAPPEEWISREELRAHAELADLEVLRQPQAANPSYVTKRQFAVISKLFCGDGYIYERSVAL